MTRNRHHEAQRQLASRQMAFKNSFRRYRATRDDNRIQSPILARASTPFCWNVSRVSKPGLFSSPRKPASMDTPPCHLAMIPGTRCMSKAWRARSPGQVSCLPSNDLFSRLCLGVADFHAQHLKAPLQPCGGQTLRPPVARPWAVHPTQAHNLRSAGLD